MQTNFFSALAFAALISTATHYQVAALTPVSKPETTHVRQISSLEVVTDQPITMISDELQLAGQSGQVKAPIIALATPSGQLPQTIQATTKPSASPTATPKPTSTPKPVVTPVPTATPVALQPHELDPLFDKYAAEYGVEARKLKAIAKCESNFNAAVVSKNGLYGGMYQYVASTWSGTRKQMGLDPNPDLRFNAEEAIRTTAFKISRGGIGAWPHCGKK